MPRSTVQPEMRHRTSRMWRNENEWSLKRTRFVSRYLDAESGSLKVELPYQLSSVSYEALGGTEHAEFTYTFDKETELTGSMRLRLWVSTSEGDDMDIFVQLDKLDASGKKLPFVAFSMFSEGPLALGWLRASHREMEPRLTQYNRPWMKHQRKLTLRPGEIVPVDIEIIASSTRFLAGETLKVTVQGTDIFRNDEVGPTMLHENTVNKGRHTIHTGAVFDSYLVLPIIDP